MNALSAFSQTYGTFNNLMIIASTCKVGEIINTKVQVRSAFFLTALTTIEGVALSGLLYRVAANSGKPLQFAATLLSVGLVFSPALLYTFSLTSMIKRYPRANKLVDNYLSPLLGIANMFTYSALIAKVQYPYLISGIKKIAPTVAQAVTTSIYRKAILGGGVTVVNVVATAILLGGMN